MDGSSSRDFLTENIKQPNDVTIDYATDYLYWTDSGMGRIERVLIGDLSKRQVYAILFIHILVKYRECNDSKDQNRRKSSL